MVILYLSQRTTMNKAFPLALCRLSLWLIISLEVSEFVHLHEYISPVSLWLQQLYPSTSCLSNRPKDLEMSFPSVGSLCNWAQSAVHHLSTYLVAVIVADSSSVAVSWDSSNILLPSGDVKSNPEPCRPDENPIHCMICSAKIKWDIQREIAPFCIETNCQLWCHQACNGLSSCTDTSRKF